MRGNVQWVHKTINLMKNSLSEKEFLEWASAVTYYQTSPTRKGIDQ